MRNYKDLITAMVRAQDSDMAQLPRAFRQWASISAVAGAMGRTVWFDSGAFQVGANMFICLVGGPGSGKSASLILPLRHVFPGITTPLGTSKGDENFNIGLSTYDLDDRPRYVMGAKVTPEKLVQEMAKLGRLDIELASYREPSHYDSSMTLVTSEFGTFMNRDDQYTQMFLTEMWDRLPSFDYLTKTSGEAHIKGPCLNWIACATPTELVRHLPENARSQGLLSRIIVVYDPSESRTDDLEYKRVKPGTIEAFTSDLAKIAHMRGPMTFEESFYAKARADVQAGLEPRPVDPNLGEYLQRRHWQCVKLAMVYSASRSNERIIREGDWERAKGTLFEAERNMPQALTLFGRGRVGRTMEDLNEHLRAFVRDAKGGMPEAAFRRKVADLVSTPGEVEQVIQTMISSNMVRRVKGKLQPCG